MSLNFLVFNERQAHTSDIFSLAVSQDAVLSTSSDGTIKAWDLITNEMVFEIPKAFKLGGHSISCAENTLAGVGFLNDVTLFDLTSRSQTCILSNHKGDDSPQDSASPSNWTVAISPDAATLATTTSSGALQVFDIASKERVASIETRGKFGMCVEYAGNSRSIAIGHVGGGLFIFDTESGKLKHSLNQFDTIRSIRFSPASEVLASAGDSKIIQLHDVRTGEQIGQLSGHSNIITCIDWNQTGELLVTGSVDGRIKVWNIARRECVGTFTENIGHKIWSIRWCKLGPNRLEGFVVGGSEKVLRFYLPTSV